MEERYTVAGMDEVESDVRMFCQTGELAYITVQERGHDEQKDDSVGRHVVQYPGDRAANQTEEDALFGTLHPDSFALGPADGLLPEDTALNWLRRELIRHMTGCKTLRFRIKLMSTKGHKQLRSGTVVVHDTQWDTGANVPSAPMPGLTQERRELGNIQAASDVRGRLDVLDFARRGMAYVLEGVAEVTLIQGKQNSAFVSVFETLQGQIDSSEERAKSAHELAQSVLRERSEADTKRIEAEANRDVTERTITQVVDRISEAVNLGMTAKYGLTPEMIEVGKALSSNSDIRRLLTDPDVQTIIQDEGMQEVLANMLAGAAANYKAERERLQLESQPPQETDEAASADASTQGVDETGGEGTPSPAQDIDTSSPPPPSGEPPAGTADADEGHPIPPVPAGFMEQDNG